MTPSAEIIGMWLTCVPNVGYRSPIAARSTRVAGTCLDNYWHTSQNFRILANLNSTILTFDRASIKIFRHIYSASGQNRFARRLGQSGTRVSNKNFLINRMASGLQNQFFKNINFRGLINAKPIATIAINKFRCPWFRWKFDRLIRSHRMRFYSNLANNC